jgi:hypothetical protein
MADRNDLGNEIIANNTSHMGNYLKNTQLYACENMCDLQQYFLQRKTYQLSPARIIYYRDVSRRSL